MSAPRARPGDEDIIDEALFLFKANVLFRNFEVKGKSDRLLIYLTLYITECLKKIEASRSKADATKALTNMALEAFSIPGDPGFPLGPYFPAPESKQESGERARVANFALLSAGADSYPTTCCALCGLADVLPTHADFMRSYLRQLREETGRRLIDRCYLDGEETTPSKWWIAFSKRRFMNKSLS